MTIKPSDSLLLKAPTGWQLNQLKTGQDNFLIDASKFPKTNLLGVLPVFDGFSKSGELFYSRMPVIAMGSNDQMPVVKPGFVENMPIKKIKVVDPLALPVHSVNP